MFAPVQVLFGIKEAKAKTPIILDAKTAATLPKDVVVCDLQVILIQDVTMQTEHGEITIPAGRILMEMKDKEVPINDTFRLNNLFTDITVTATPAPQGTRVQ